MLVPDLHTGFSRGRSGGLVFPSLSEFCTVYCGPHSQRLWHSQQRCFSGTLLLFWWSSRCWQFDLWFLWVIFKSILYCWSFEATLKWALCLLEKHFHWKQPQPHISLLKTQNSDAKRPLKGQLREPGQVLLVSFVFKDWMPQGERAWKLLPPARL